MKWYQLTMLSSRQGACGPQNAGKTPGFLLEAQKRNGLARKLVQKKEKTSTKSLSAAEISGGKAAALLWGFENLSP